MSKKDDDIESNESHDSTKRQVQEDEAAMKEILIRLSLDKAHNLAPQDTNFPSDLSCSRREELLCNDMFTWPDPKNFGIGDGDDNQLIMESLYLEKIFSSLWKNIKSFFTHSKKVEDTTAIRHPILLNQKESDDKSDKEQLRGTYEEKRAYRRYEIPSAHIGYKPKGIKSLVTPRSKEGEHINISKGGLGFNCHEDINVGDRIRVDLYLPYGVCWPLNGIVAWKGKNNGALSVGIEFDKVKTDKEFHANGINIDAIQELVAFHQAAHVVIAYFLGLTPEYVRLHGNGDGAYRIGFGEKSFLADPLMMEVISPDLLTSCSKLSRDITFDLAKRVCYILIAGGVAESFAKTRSLYIGTNEIGLNGTDLCRASTIAEHFSIDLTQEIIFLYDCLKDERLWGVIEKLANDLLINGENGLDKDGIFSSFKDSGYYDFIADQSVRNKARYYPTNQVDRA